MTNNWTNETIIDFINEVHLHPELWNLETRIYKDKKIKRDGWIVVADKFGISSNEAYKKFRSLRTYAKNEEKKKKSGSAGGKPVKWFAFDAISFILSQNIQNTGLNSENGTENATENQDVYISTDLVEVVDSETNDPLQTLATTTKRPAKKSKTDPILEKARNIKRDAGIIKNEYAGFGEHIANKLSKYDGYTRAQAEFKIMQILYECDMEMYRNQPSSFTQSSNNNSRGGASTSDSQYSDI